MLGVNPNAERQPEDFYATDPKALTLLLKKLSIDGIMLNNNIWECACGMGHLSRVLEAEGYSVTSTDLINRGYGRGGINFIDTKDKELDCDILTNPPFKLAEKFVETAMSKLSEGGKLLLFLKIQFLEGQKRKEMFKKYPLKYVYCYSSRQLCCKDAEFEKYTSTTQFYAWYIWEKGFSGETIIRWI